MIAEKRKTGGGELAALKRWPDALGDLQARVAGRFRRPRRSGSERTATSPAFSGVWNAKTAGRWPKRWESTDRKGHSAS